MPQKGRKPQAHPLEHKQVEATEVVPKVGSVAHQSFPRRDFLVKEV